MKENKKAANLKIVHSLMDIVYLDFQICNKKLNSFFQSLAKNGQDFKRK